MLTMSDTNTGLLSESTSSYKTSTDDDYK